MSREPVISLNLYPQWVTEIGQAWVKGATDLLAHNKLPLSGDVSQWISAWGEAVGQIGLFNINTVNSSDPRMERDIGINYSYGRQLGRILDVLTPMVASYEQSADAGKMDPQKLKEFKDMVAHIQRLKDAKTPSQADLVRDAKRLSAKLSHDEVQQLRQALLEALPATQLLL